MSWQEDELYDEAFGPRSLVLHRVHGEWDETEEDVGVLACRERWFEEANDRMLRLVPWGSLTEMRAVITETMCSPDQPLVKPVKVQLLETRAAKQAESEKRQQRAAESRAARAFWGDSLDLGVA